MAFWLDPLDLICTKTRLVSFVKYVINCLFVYALVLLYLLMTLLSWLIIRFDIFMFIIVHKLNKINKKKCVKPCMQLLGLFCYFLKCWSISWLKIIKTEASIPLGINMTQLFVLCFFSFSVRQCSKMAEMGPKMVKNHFSPPGG